MNRIKELREEIGMTQVRLSIDLEAAQETISAYEHGKHYPSIPALIKMMEMFNSSIDYILGFSDVRKPVKTFEDKELVLIGNFKKLPDFKRELALAYIQGLTDGERNK